MRILRIRFEKTKEAAYISHLDLQRVFSRALRISGLPVWYSQGFNPHIYMSFALPLPLLHQSVCEAVDVKTESELTDFSGFVGPLTRALPRGIEVFEIVEPIHKAEAIDSAVYRISYPDAEALEKAIEGYNQLGQAMVTRRTKRSEQEVDLKEKVPLLERLSEKADSFEVCLPAGGGLNYNPALLCGLLEDRFGLSAARAEVMRLQVYTGGEIFK